LCEPWTSEQLQTWATSETPSPPGPGHNVRVRIAACTGTLFGDVKLHLQRKEYLVLEENFDLHANTLPALASRFGAFEHYLEHEGSPSSMQKMPTKLRMYFSKPRGIC
jgi:hypothetical protein